MLPTNEMKKRPLLERPRAVRIKFTKTGSQRYISHLDLQRTFTRAIIRSGIPVWYTKGFNPHSKLVFSSPLPIGCESICDYVDIKIDREASFEEIKSALSAQFTDEMLILDVYEPQAKFQDIVYINYKAEITRKKASDELAAKIEEALKTSPFIITKKSKSGDKEVDLTSFLPKVSAKKNGKKIVLEFTVGDGFGNTLSPEIIMRAVISRFELIEDEMYDYYSLLRTEILARNMRPFR